MIPLLTVALFCASPAPTMQVGLGTEYSRKGRGLACLAPRRSRLITPEAQALLRGGRFIAHRTVTCWSVAWACVVRSGRCERVTVADRGPYGKSSVDLWKKVARRLKFNGRERVLLLHTNGKGGR